MHNKLELWPGMFCNSHITLWDQIILNVRIILDVQTNTYTFTVSGTMEETELQEVWPVREDAAAIPPIERPLMRWWLLVDKGGEYTCNLATSSFLCISRNQAICTNNQSLGKWIRGYYALFLGPCLLDFILVS